MSTLHFLAPLFLLSPPPSKLSVAAAEVEEDVLQSRRALASPDTFVFSKKNFQFDFKFRNRKYLANPKYQKPSVAVQAADSRRGALLQRLHQLDAPHR